MKMLLGLGVLGIFLLFTIIVSIFLFLFWILMIIDCAKRKFKEDSERIVWILVLIFTGIIGALVYYFAVKNKKK